MSSEPPRRPAGNKGHNISSGIPAQSFVALGAGRQPQRTGAAGLFGSGDSVSRRNVPAGSAFLPLGSSAAGSQIKKEKAPSSGRPAGTLDKKSGEQPEWQKLAADFDSKNFISAVRMVAAGDRTISEVQMQPLICGAIHHLIHNRLRDLDDVLVTSLARLANVRPEYFRSSVVLGAVIALVKKDSRDNTLSSTATLKGKSSIPNCILGTNLLYCVFQKVERWPEQLMMVYLDDAANERQWVDLTECREFAQAIRFTFGTRAAAKDSSVPMTEVDSTKKTGPASKSSLFEDVEKAERRSPSPGATSTAASSVSGGVDEDSNLSGIISSLPESITARFDRFEHCQADVPEMVMGALSNAFKRINETGRSQVLSKFLITTAGIPQVRLFAIQNISIWLNSPKTEKFGMSLIAAICANTSGTNAEDQTIIDTILKLRSVSKMKPQYLDSYFSSLKELMDKNSKVVEIIIQQLVDTEMADLAILRRNAWNLTVLSAAVNLKPAECSHILGSVFLYRVLRAGDDAARNLKTIIHDLVKTYRADIRFGKFISAVLNTKIVLSETVTKQLKSEDTGMRDRRLLHLLDVVIAAEAHMVIKNRDEILIGSTESIVGMLTRSQQQKLELLKAFRETFPTGLTQEAITQSMRRILVLDKQMLFGIAEKWPSETEKELFMKTASYIPVTSNTLSQIVGNLQGCDPALITTPLESLVERGLKLRLEDKEIFNLQELDHRFIMALFSLGVFQRPSSFVVSGKYRSPEIIKRDHNWNCWRLVAMLAAADPQNFGKLIWETYQNGAAIMQMLIINRFDFPPETMVTETRPVKWFLDNEQKLLDEETNRIVELENRLHGGNSKNLVINKATAVLPREYMLFDLQGQYRQPSDAFHSSLKRLNRECELGRLLSSCRDPDFLVGILEHRGTAASLPWLLELTSSSKSMFEVLPVECVCEMLFHSLSKRSPGSAEKKEQDALKCRNLAGRLSESVRQDSQETQNIAKILEFFFHRLGATTREERLIARTALEIFFDPKSIDERLAKLWGEPVAGTAKKQTNQDWPMTDITESKHGLSIEHLLQSSNRNWDFFSHLDEPMPQEPVVWRFKWLLDDLCTMPQFPVLRDTLCLLVAKALENEMDTDCVCAYLIFVGEHLFEGSGALNVAATVQEYLTMILVADILVFKAELRDHLLVQTSDITSTDPIRLTKSFRSLFECFLIKARKTGTDVLQQLAAFGATSQDQLALVRIPSAESISITAAIGGAIFVFVALNDATDDKAPDPLLDFCLTQSATQLGSGDPLDLLTSDIREIVLKHSNSEALIQRTLKDITVEQVVDLICCRNLRDDVLSKLTRLVDVNDERVRTLMRFVISKHPLSARKIIEMRCADSIGTDAVQQTMKSFIAANENAFSKPFSI